MDGLPPKPELMVGAEAKMVPLPFKANACPEARAMVLLKVAVCEKLTGPAAVMLVPSDERKSELPLLLNFNLAPELSKMMALRPVVWVNSRDSALMACPARFATENSEDNPLAGQPIRTPPRR
jgi:hypothetical protein